MNMAKNQDLPLNPAKVSGVCGRLLCCLSYENDQYRQMKAVMPKLGQAIDTPGGMGQVVSMQLLKELVTVRLDEENMEATFRCDELGLGAARNQASAVLDLAKPAPVASEEETTEIAVATVAEMPVASTARRRRRRSGRRPGPAR
jgi:cell fate regulator YaaT (PSP1 superfamily)